MFKFFYKQTPKLLRNATINQSISIGYNGTNMYQAIELVFSILYSFFGRKNTITNLHDFENLPINDIFHSIELSKSIARVNNTFVK